MDSSSVRATRLGWLGEFTRYQWTVFLIAWIGWALDATDFDHPRTDEVVDPQRIRIVDRFGEQRSVDQRLDRGAIVESFEVDQPSLGQSA